MAISRREALKRGISYGTGVMHHENDSIVYDRALRAFPAHPAFGELTAAIEAGNVETALEKAQAFRQLCGDLAMSELFMRCNPILQALADEELPAVEDVDALREQYNLVTEYLSKA